MKELKFEKQDSVYEFCQRYYDNNFYKDSQSRQHVMQFQNRYLVAGTHSDILNAISDCMDNMAEAPCDFIIYRAGTMKYRTERPYIGASFLRSTATRYSNGFGNIHKIVVRKGAKLIPMISVNLFLDKEYLDKDTMEHIRPYGDPECDIILDASRLRWCGAYYEYIQ